MQTILPPSENTLKILGKPKVSENGYRLMKYVLTKPCDDGVLLFHVLTREMLLLTDEEYKSSDKLQELRDKWFMVPQALDDKKYADQVRFIRKTIHKKPEHTTGYTIFTTTDCNARCFYCYEMGRSRIPMSEETAHKTAAYIADHCGGKKVKLSWFGGEPLFNKQVIDIICGDLSERGIEYRSSIISNGYLFDEETVRKAVDLWNLNWVQIALDGTEEVFNRSKAFIYKDGQSPYRIVMANIGRLLDAGVRVFVRMNMDEHNAENLFELADELHKRFADKKGLYAYSHVLFEFSGSKERVRAEEERRRIYEKQRQLSERLYSYGLKMHRGLKKVMPVNMCMADSGNSLTILPGGELGLCEHYSEDNFVGHIDSEVLDGKMVQSFRETWEQIDDCAECFYYPACIRLKKCLEQKECYPEMREDTKQSILDSMQETYEKWLKNENEDEDDRPELC
ncbi:MAG: radical SAM protein [Oscillospiraceae bacterium]